MLTVLSIELLKILFVLMNFKINPGLKTYFYLDKNELIMKVNIVK